MTRSFLLPLWFFVLASTAIAQTDDAANLIAPDGTTVLIERDAYGVPHVRAESEVGVFFGQGFAVAQDRLEQLDQFSRAGTGRLSEIFSLFTVGMDQETRTRYYTEAERVAHFEALRPELRAGLRAYSEGINTYIDSMAVNPSRFTPLAFRNRKMTRWTVTQTVAVMQFLMRQFGQFGGRELERLRELTDNGQVWFDENRPVNDPSAPTTIPSSGGALFRAVEYAGPIVRREAILEMEERGARVREVAHKLGIPLTFGSFATLVSPDKSATGNVMLLGAPQMGPPLPGSVSVTHEVELDSPDLHVIGMAVAGIPGVIIGHNGHYAWTMTSGISDNTDVYIETTQDSTFSTYRYDGEWVGFEAFQDSIPLLNGPALPFTHYRTVHGPVVGSDLQNGQVFTEKMTFWESELNMADTFYDVWKGRTIDEFEAAILRSPMSFNAFYAGRDQQIAFWHVGSYQNREDGVDPRLPHNGDGTEEWVGFIDKGDLPHVANPSQGYLVNWNNKPAERWNNGDNIPWAGTSSQTVRVSAIDNFVGPIASVTYDQLKEVPLQIRDRGTYQQAIEFSPDGVVNDESVAPPGQSGFTSLGGDRSPHRRDQWQLHLDGRFKDMIFGSLESVAVDPVGGPDVAFVIERPYPNPSRGSISLTYRVPEFSHVRIAIFDVLGREVGQVVDAERQPGSHTEHVDVSFLAGGLYTVLASDRRVSVAIPIVVTH